VARAKRDPNELAAKDRVVVDLDLPGVRAGSSGVIVGVSGLDWIRYRVRFDNGVTANLIDPSHLERTTKA